MAHGGSRCACPVASVRSERKEAPIVTTLIVSQGRLADELLAAARKIVGDGCGIAALSLDWEDSFEAALSKLRRAVEGLEIGDDDGLLILTDIYGGTTTNVALTLREPGKVEVVSGVNLPMVVRLGCGSGASQMSLEEAARWIGGKARSSIRCGCSEREEAHVGA